MKNYFSYENLVNDEEQEEVVFGEFLSALPFKGSYLWNRGFVWKGVYFKLQNAQQTKTAEKVIKKLKYMAIDFFNTETSKKVDLQPLNSDEYDKQGDKQIFMGKKIRALMHFQLPLINIISTSSYSVLVSPVVYSLLDSGEDAIQINKLLMQNDIQSTFPSGNYYTTAIFGTGNNKEVNLIT